jgi:hypothetical protein
MLIIIYYSILIFLKQQFILSIANNFFYHSKYILATKNKHYQT